MLCPNCNSEFKTYDKGRRFCSKPCYEEYRTAHPEEYGKKEQTYPCAYCGKPGIKRKPSQLRNNVYCSRECSNKAQSEAIKELTDIDTSNGVKLNCAFCGSEFFVKPYKAKIAKFCCTKCSSDYRANRPMVIKVKRDQRGEKNSNFRNWHARNAVRNNAIKLLGHKCALCDFDIVVHVHHIVPAAIGGPNDIHNLIVLCPNHHEMADRGMIPAESLSLLNPFAVARQLENQPPFHQQQLFEHSNAEETP